MNLKTIERMIKWILAAAALFTGYIILHLVVYNPIRGDEFLSFLHSDPEWESLGVVMGHIYGGADNSYTHAAILYFVFSFFGYSIVVQRMVSLAFWFVGMFLVREILRKEIDNRLHVWFTSFIIAFSNFGIYLATDGRFYAILFSIAAGMMLLYINRMQLKPFFYFILLFIIQLAGLLTSSNYMVLQILFVIALIIHARITGSIAEKHFIRLSVLATILSTSIYFLFFRISYFHQFFATNLFAPKPFNSGLFTEFISTPFRWIMMPHIPPLTDMMDVLIFIILLLLLIIAKRTQLAHAVSSLSSSFKAMGFITALLLLFMVLQLAALFIGGIPLWPARYYTPVFFIAAMFLAGTLVISADLRILALLLFAFCLRITFVEFPKIEVRKAEQDRLSIEELGWKHENKPIVFVETETDYSVFSVLGNMYTGNTQLKDRLILKYNAKDSERANYFLRLKAFHYPLQFIDQVDSTKQIIVSPSTLSE
jgi:hypothetical protein